ncbi:Glutaminase [Saliniradius amylolyticus]|uniref:Glutaminase n=1 Tax=Saliniradius amylolyticus TaxID=2183582 RepID=A0A2S2E5L6_9ALTE|nr:glutaminase [Saliniradius amylolyticus]AWL12832.1 Glutaminase [Saliniradius amylolyticus]
MEGTPIRPQDTDQLLQSILSEARQNNQGKVASYIPALANVDPECTAIAMVTNQGQFFQAGDADTPFSIQSISKIFGLVMAMRRSGNTVWQRVNMEPSGQPFNSIVQLEWEYGIPRNPFINAGAIVIADMLVSQYSTSKLAFIGFLRQLAGTDRLYVDEEVYESELTHGSRNAAMAYLMHSFGNMEADVDQVLEHYFYQCSIPITCKQLARSLCFLANRGVDPFTDESICSRRDAHRVNAILSTSGMYDQSGEFAFSVGLPAKSGVGGAIAAIIPGLGAVVAWSPRLNHFGNSHRGMTMITRLAEEMGLSVFGV